MSGRPPPRPTHPLTVLNPPYNSTSPPKPPDDEGRSTRLAHIRDPPDLRPKKSSPVCKPTNHFTGSKIYNYCFTSNFDCEMPSTSLVSCPSATPQDVTCHWSGETNQRPNRQLDASTLSMSREGLNREDVQNSLSLQTTSTLTYPTTNVKSRYTTRGTVCGVLRRSLVPSGPCPGTPAPRRLRTSG